MTTYMVNRGYMDNRDIRRYDDYMVNRDIRMYDVLYD